MNKEQEYKSIYTEFKKLKKVTAVSFREHLQSHYPYIWQSDLQDKSIERRIKRILDKLVLFGIATKEKIGKENVYALIQDGNLDETYFIANALNINTKNSLYKTRESIISKINNTSNIYYINQENEDISNKEKIIKKLELAIELKKYVKVIYNQEDIQVMPLKLALFDGYWYLVAYNSQYITMRIKNISSVKVLKSHYEFKDSLDLSKWHNRYHNPKVKPTKVKLFIDKFVVSYFKERNLLKINDNPKQITYCNDGIEYDVFITNKWELLSTLMQWQIYVTILEQEGEIDIKSIYNDVLIEIKGRFSCNS